MYYKVLVPISLLKLYAIINCKFRYRFITCVKLAALYATGALNFKQGMIL